MRRLTAALAVSALATLTACSHSQTGALPATAGLDEAQMSGDSYLSGKAALANGETGRAVERFRRALRSNPQSVPALNGLAVAYDEIGRFDVAQALYRRALALDPRSPETLNNLGRSLTRQGAASTALPYLAMARERAAQSQLPVIDANIATARAALADPARPHRAAPEDSALERTGAREHRLRTGPTPRRLIAAEPSISRPSGGLPAVESPVVRPPLVEVANGAGRRRMAARVGNFLRGHGIPVGRLTNAASFNHAKTLILYRSGHEKDAIRIARLLPIPVEPALDDAQPSGVRVVLGHDLSEFDRQLFPQAKGADA